MFQVRTESSSSPRALPRIDWRGERLLPRSGRLVIAGVLTVLIPGLGHLLMGRTRKGWSLIGISAGLLALAIAIIPREPFAALAMFSQPRNLELLLVADLGLLLFRAYALIDLLRRPSPGAAPLRANPALAVLLAGLLLLTAAPHAAVAWYDIVTYRFLEDVFGDEGEAPVAVAPGEVELTREVRLADGVVPAAPPVVESDD